MHATIEIISDVKRRVKLFIPSEELQNKVNGRLRTINKHTKVKGFRSGNIPIYILEKKVGKSVLKNIVLDLVQSNISEAIKKQSFQLASEPELERLPETNNLYGILEFSARFEVYPSIPHIDISAIEIKRPHTFINKTNVDEMIQAFRKQRQVWDDVEERPQAGDQVAVEFECKTVEGIPSQQNCFSVSLLMGSSEFAEMENAVSGLLVSNTKELELRFPENYGDQYLAGKAAVVVLELKRVMRLKLPKINHVFIKSLGIESGFLSDLRVELMSILEYELNQATKIYLKSQLIRVLLDIHPQLEVPDSMISQEAENLLKKAKQNRGIRQEKLSIEQFISEATNRVRGSLLLAKIAEQDNIEADDKKIYEVAETITMRFEQPKEAMKSYLANPEHLSSIKNIAREQQVVDWVMRKGSVIDEPMPFKDVIKFAQRTAVPHP